MDLTALIALLQRIDLTTLLIALAVVYLLPRFKNIKLPFNLPFLNPTPAPSPDKDSAPSSTPLLDLLKSLLALRDKPKENGDREVLDLISKAAMEVKESEPKK